MKKAFDASGHHKDVYSYNPLNDSDVAKYSFGFLTEKYNMVSDSRLNEYPAHVIRDIYVSAQKNQAREIFNNYHSCFASDFTMFIMDLFENNYVVVDEKFCVDSSFYDFVCSRGWAIAEIYGISDTEMVKIFTKQLVIMLRSMDYIDLSLGRVKVLKNFSENDLTIALFREFWDNISWSELFPSLPQLAVTLQKNRFFLSEMLLMSEYPVHLERIGFDFLLKSKVRLRNEILLISFLDFSVFSWLNLFGFIKYLDQDCGKCVMIDLTEYGRKILSAI